MITYLHSKALDLPIKLDTETGEITIKDQKKYGSRGYVKYSKDEVDILNELGGITPAIHLCKSIFDGIIVKEIK